MNKLKDGQEYEKYVRDIIKPKYKNVWLWNDVPNHIMTTLDYIKSDGTNCDDIGCDLICETNNSTFEYVQCKNYSTTGNDNTINISDLSGFYNFVAENELSKVSYVYYSGKLSSQVIKRRKAIRYINLPIVKFKCFEDKFRKKYQFICFFVFARMSKIKKRYVELS